jgi:hypothetical protein
MHVDGSHIFLVKIEMVLSHKWAHPKNTTCQISLSERYVCRNCTGLGTGTVVPAWKLQDAGVELLHMLHKLMHADALGVHEHICDVVRLLLSLVVGGQGEKVEYHAVVK